MFSRDKRTMALLYSRFVSVLKSMAPAIAVFILSAAFTVCSQTEKPNVIFILADDLGWRDAGCYGSTYYETPHIDHLASEGMRFTCAYAACAVCSPTRASILTGKYPARLHLTDWIPGNFLPRKKLRPPDWTRHLALTEMNLGRVFKASGYATASIGKWHLGGPDFYPEKQGFDVNIGGMYGGMTPSYFSPYNIPTLTNGPPGEFLSNRLTAEAIQFIENHRAQPFFIYLPHYAVHVPITGKREIIEKYRLKFNPPGDPQRNPIYAALVESLDDSVGQIQATLDRLGLSRNTIIVLTSDNGGETGARHSPTSNRPLRRGKGSPYEGGIRVPLIVKWPGVTLPGQISEHPVSSIDFYPTLLEMAGIPDAVSHQSDGASIVPLLTGTGLLADRSLYWHYPHYRFGVITVPPYGIVRDGDFKLIEYFEDGNRELYNLRHDLGERQNLVMANPSKTRELTEKLHLWRKAVGAQMPVLNNAAGINPIAEDEIVEND